VTPTATTVHTFGDFELDERLFELRRSGAIVKIEPKVFDVMRYLVNHAERVVAKDELLDALWPGEHVSDSVLPRCITVARKALGDDPNAQRMIQTVHGRGYRFVAEVRRPTGARTPAPAPAAVAMPERNAFVGRVEAMAVLRSALADAEGGRGRLLLLVGEPVSGTTPPGTQLPAAGRGGGGL
jgi:DNA-binding winged helix-turn-helix (wHTH) protein